MSKLNIDQKTISGLLGDKKADFLIPDYQRPYAWTEDECATLWDDIFTFAFPDEDYTKFDSENDEYFLGPIVTFKNEDGKQEVIDGQQRLTTIMLLLRAFYSKFGNMKDENSRTTLEELAKCVWRTNEFGKPDMNKLKIDSEVASDADKEEFLEILRTGIADGAKKSRYARTFQFFEQRIDKFISEYPSYTAYLPMRIMNNVILLPIEAESQSTALQIFSTLNDRGLPLSDADIFKSQFYKYFAGKGQKDSFVKRWKSLEELCEEIFSPSHGTPMDELFTRYMYYERAKQGNRNTTTEALRDFYEKNKYELLKSETTFSNLEALAEFWKEVYCQGERFSDEVQRKLFVLSYAPNGMWTYLVSVYFMHNRDSENGLDDQEFSKFLSLITAFIWAYAIERPGVNALRSPVYPELINIVNGQAVTFERYRFGRNSIRASLSNYQFTNGRPITRSMLTWWAYRDASQPLFDLDTKLEIEHIYAKKRAENENTLSDQGNLEALGNKALLEKRINIRVSDYRIADKKKYYMGFTNSKGQIKEGTKVLELQKLANEADDFTEKDIVERTEKMISAFILSLEENGLLAD